MRHEDRTSVGDGDAIVLSLSNADAEERVAVRDRIRVLGRDGRHMRRDSAAGSDSERQDAQAECDENSHARSAGSAFVERSRSVIFCQILPDNPVTSVSISLTVLSTMGSLNDWMNDAAI